MILIETLSFLFDEKTSFNFLFNKLNVPMSMSSHGDILQLRNGMNY